MRRGSTYRPGLALLVLCALCALADVLPARGQVLRLVPQQTRLGSSYDGNWRTNAGLTDRSFAQNNFRQWLVLPFDGALGRRPLLQYRFELQPTLSQQLSTDLPDPLQTRNMAYSADVSLLASAPVSLQTYAARTNGLRQGGFGTQGSFSSSIFKPTLHLQNRLLPVTVSWTDQTNRNITQVGPSLTPIEMSDQTQTFRAAASNRKIDLAYERMAFDDRRFENDFEARSFHVNHTFRWGKRSEIVSRYQWIDRDGALPYARKSWSEAVRLQHTDATYTRLGMSRFDADGLGGRSRGEAYNWAMFSDVRPWLGLGADASTSSSRFDGGRQRVTSAGPQARVGIHLPYGLYVSGSGSLGFLRRDIAQSDNRFATVLREAYPVDQSLLVLLEQTDIDLTSVLVQSGDETLVYVEGLDYRLVAVGALVQVEVLAGSRIEAGQRILVSYRYRPEIDAQERGTVGSLDLGVRVDGFSITHHRSRRATSMGQDLITGDFRQRNTSLRFQRRLPIGQLRVTMSHRTRTSATIDYTATEALATLGLPEWRIWTLTVDAVARRVSEAADRLYLYSLNTTALWALPANLQLRTTASYQYWEQRLTDAQRILSLTAALDYTVGQTQIRLNYAYDHRTIRFVTSGNRLSLYLLRRF